MVATQTQTTTAAAQDRDVGARTNRATDLKGMALGGLLAGLIGGVAMAMTAMIRAWVVGMGFWLPPKLIAATFYDVEALVGDAWVVIVGLMIHMVMSAALGAVFGVLGGARASAGAACALGLVYGVVVWAASTYIGLPLVNEVMSERMAMQPVWWFVYHLIFGAMLLFTPPLARSFSTRR